MKAMSASSAGHVIAAARARFCGTREAANVARAQAASASTDDSSHAECLAIITYAAQNADMATVPKSIPMAERAANADPWSTARKTDTGAEVSGSPAMRPPSAAPHLR